LTTSKLAAALLFVVVSGCAETPPPAPQPAPAPAPRPTALVPDAGAPDRTVLTGEIHAADPNAADTDTTVETRHLSEKQWLVEVRTKLAQQLKIDPAELRLSNDRQWAVIVRGPPPPPAGKKARKGPRHFQIVVTGVDGKHPQTFRPVTVKGSDEPPRDVHFLADDRLVYEVVLPPPPPAAPSHKPARRSATAHPPAKAHPPAPRPMIPDPHLPARLFVIQPLGKRARPLRCPGTRFGIPAQQDHLAVVGGTTESGFVSVDGVQVYPRKGRTAIGSDPAWSKDGHSLAFIELRPPAAARLVLLAEFDNPSGDTTWDLPVGAALEGVRVSWAGPGKLLVGRASMRPLFAAPFWKQAAPPSWREP
jgi:hypothetical protein